MKPEGRITLIDLLLVTTFLYVVLLAGDWFARALQAPRWLALMVALGAGVSLVALVHYVVKLVRRKP